MTKNIVVLDENGKKAGKTFPKRAKGLVKSGRAEYVDEAVIRLVAPPSAPDERTEPNMKSEVNINEIVGKVEQLMAELNKQTAAAYATLEKADSDEKIAMVGNIVKANSEAVNKAIDFYKSILPAKAEEPEAADEAEEKEPAEAEEE